MLSPFPGVDPYLESQHHWQDFHLTFINAWREAINASLPENYGARFEEHDEILEVGPETARLSRPDIAVVRLPKVTRPPFHPSRARSPLQRWNRQYCRYPMMEEVHQRWIEILYRPDREVVAVLELAFADQQGGSRGRYLAVTVTRFHSEDVHLVEVDLLLAESDFRWEGRFPPATATRLSHVRIAAPRQKCTLGRCGKNSRSYQYRC